MQQHELLHDGKAEARAPRLPGPRLVHAVEAVEYVGQVLLGDAHARVADRDHGLPAGTGQHAMDLAAPGRVLDGVVDDVVNHLLQLQRVAVDLQRFLCHAVQFDAALPGQGREPLDLLLQQGPDVQVGEVQLHAAVDADQRQKVADDAVQAVDLLVDVVHEILGHGGIHRVLVEEGLDQDLDGAQRGFQLVGGVGDELAPGLVQLFQALGHRIERLGEACEFVLAAHTDPGGQVALAHAGDAVVQFADGPGDGAQHQRVDHQHRQRDDGHPGQYLELYIPQILVDLLDLGDIDQHAQLVSRCVAYAPGVEPGHGFGS